MRNLLILLIILTTITGCGPAYYIADLAIKKGQKILRPEINCQSPKYNFIYNIIDLDMKERFELAGKKTGCFALDKFLPEYTLTAVLTKKQILEVRLHQNKSIIDIHSYQFNELNLQDKIEESLQDILLEITKKERHYAQNQ